jgi:hypothetical protein
VVSVARAAAGARVGPAFAVLLLLACTGAGPEPQPARGHGGHVAPAAPASDAVAQLVSQLVQVHDYRRFAAGAASLGRWERDIPRPTEGAFLFLRGFDRWERFPLTTGGTSRGLVFEEDGSMSPSVVLPAYELAASDRAALASLLSAPATAALGDWGRRHHVFVTFSAEGVRQVAVGFDSGTWRGDGIKEVRPDRAVIEELRAICRRAGAPLCNLGSPAATEAHERWWAEERERTLHGSWRRKSRPLPLDAQKPLAALSAAERRLACLWNLEHLDSLFEPRPGRWLGHTSGVWARARPWRRCVESFPACDARVKDVEPCMEVAQKGDIWLAQTEQGLRCATKRACMWGFDWAHGAEPPTDEE